jgi:hypothetical protein
MESFTPLQATLGIAHGDLWLVCGKSAMETHFMKLPMNSYCAGLASRGSWNSVVSVSIEDGRFLRNMCFCTRRSQSVSLCSLSFPAEPLLLLEVSTSQ